MNESVKLYGARFKKEYRLIRHLIETHERIAIYRHIRPDFDAQGSQMGLYTFLMENFPEKEIYFVGDNHVSLTPRVFPETEKINDEFFTGGEFLGIILDVGDPERIADPRFSKANTLVKFDHHACRDEIKLAASVLDVEASAASEMVADFLLSWKGKKVSKTAAEYLYIGIVGDSGRFLFPSTKEHTFAVAGELLKCGIDLPSIYRRMYEKELHSLEVEAYVLTHFEVTKNGVSYYVLPCDVQEKLGITTELGKENINVFSNIKEINAWCSITQDASPKDPCWRISIRSKEKDISGVAAKYGGGGHALASGAKIKDISKLESFLKDLDALFA